MSDSVDAGDDDTDESPGQLPDGGGGPGAPDASPDDPGDPPGDDPCAVPSHATWSGSATRDNQIGYPDHIAGTVTWTRTGTSGCVDTFAPSGTVHYGYAIPGALCNQSISPDTTSIAASDGALTIDRNTAPGTYVGHAATSWMITFHCEYGDGTSDEFTFTGGGVWFDASGNLDGDTIHGDYRLDDDAVRCGPEGIAPCVYAWSLTGG